jgi:hypothetical protein
MREAERSRLPQLRIHLAKHALERLIVATATARLKTRSASPVDWPDFEEAINLVAELPGIGPHESAIAYVRGVELLPMLKDRQYGQLADLFAFLEKEIDTRTHRDFRAARWLRASALGFLLVCCGWVVVSPTNLAYGKYVTISSTCSDLPAPPLGSPKLGRAVDGVRHEHQFAICTNKLRDPWITVDLGMSYSIREVVVYGRSDGYWGVDDTPVRIRLSLDNEHFQDEQTRSVPFTCDFPWRLKVGGTKARFVQLTAATNLPKQLIINEIEVYGRSWLEAFPESVTSLFGPYQ